LKSKKTILFIALIFLLLSLFLLDLAIGSIRISISDIISIFRGNSDDEILSEIVLNYRLPKAVTAIVAGSSLSVAGLLMQTLFRNPLADPYILGVSSGASLGVAISTMGAFFIPALMGNGWIMIIAAIAGAVIVLLLVLLVSFKVKDIVSLLIVGIMFGTIAASIVSILQYFSNPDAIKLFVMWTLGSLSSVPWEYLQALLPVCITGFVIAIFLQKSLNALLLGEQYANGLGVSVKQTRVLIIVATGLLAGGVTAFTGPIAFVGVAIPHIARGLFGTSKHEIIMPACVLCGASLLLLCDIISQLPAYTLPINSISSLFGAPVILWLILKKN
jgi:iron complex transport system permease protein